MIKSGEGVVELYTVVADLQMFVFLYLPFVQSKTEVHEEKWQH
jgi:hypothetical protein